MLTAGSKGFLSFQPNLKDYGENDGFFIWNRERRGNFFNLMPESAAPVIMQRIL
jgi:hypothetical protein